MKKTETSTQKGTHGSKVSTHEFGGSNPVAGVGVHRKGAGSSGKAAGDK